MKIWKHSVPTVTLKVNQNYKIKIKAIGGVLIVIQ